MNYVSGRHIRSLLLTMIAMTILTCFVIVFSTTIFLGQPGQSNQGAIGAGEGGVSVERGKYLVTVQDCNGCHTPFKNGEPDMTKMLSGHPQDVPKITSAPKVPEGWVTAISATNTAWSTPAGVAFTSNLTPDKSTGIGNWTEDMFVRVIRTGKQLGSGRPIMPPMPWQMYSNLTDNDLKSIFAYLKTIPAISNKVPAPVPPLKQ